MTHQCWGGRNWGPAEHCGRCKTPAQLRLTNTIEFVLFAAMLYGASGDWLRWVTP
jgi:hypothetical protein